MKVKIAVVFVKWSAEKQPEECGFVEEDGVFLIPTCDVDNEKQSEQLALSIARKYTLCEIRWLSIESIGFVEMIVAEEKTVYLTFRVKLPPIMNNLEEGMVWKNIRELEGDPSVPHLTVCRRACVVS